MNKKLFILPLVAMMLTSCGNKATDYSVLPEGGESYVLVDDKGEEIPEAKATLAQKLAKVAQSTYQGLGFGLKVEGGINALKVNVQTSSLETDTSWPEANENRTQDIKINASGKASLALNGLGGKPAGLEAAVSIKNLSVDVDALVQDEYYPDENVDVDFDFSNLNMSVYFKDGNLYADLTNKTLKKVVLNVVKQVTGEELPQELQDMIFVKSYINAFDPTAESDIILPTLPVEEFAEFGEVLADILTNGASALPGLFDVKEYENGALGIQMNFTNEFFKENLEDENEYEYATSTTKVSDDTELSLAIYFNEDGFLESIGVKGNIDVVEDYHYLRTWTDSDVQQKNEITTHNDVKVTIDSYVSVSFGKQKISFPSFADYLPLAINF